MPSVIENNTIEDTDIEQTDSRYEYNFVNTPWDDRSRRSKTCIVGLLCAIFIVTMAVVINNLIVFYKNFEGESIYTKNGHDINCNFVTVDKYRYAARIHSKASLELICLGALISTSSVLANAVCLKSGPIRLYLGSLTNHRCKKGFSVADVGFIPHDGVVTKHLVLLTARENMKDCGNIVKLSSKSIMNRQAFVIGRTYKGGRSLSFQPVTLTRIDNMTLSVGSSINNLNKHNLICAKHHLKCPVRAGDLLVQRGRLIGIASTSTQRGENNEMACFANLSLIRDELRELDIDVEFD